MKMEFALWTRGAVMQFIEREFGVRLSIRATGEYLRGWGFTPQKPIKRAYEQRPEAVKQWIEQEYPAIEHRAKAEGGEIHCGDETALVNTDVRGRSYAPSGKTPVTMAVGGTREKLSMISTVTNWHFRMMAPGRARQRSPSGNWAATSTAASSPTASPVPAAPTADMIS